MSLPALRAPACVAPPSAHTPTVRIPAAAPPLPARTRLAAGVGRLAARLARRGGRSASVIGGRVATLIDRDALARLARGRTVVLVTGTNGKTTTTSMIVRALGGPGDAVATNATGANMPDGVLSALLDAPGVPLAVMEVDESYLAEVAAATDPAVIVVLNVSRDQLDRVGEVRTVARRLGDAVAAHPHAITVTFADDVLAAGIGLRAARPVWLSSPSSWRGDAGVCPRCGGAMHHGEVQAMRHRLHSTLGEPHPRAARGPAWECLDCGLVPPGVDWSVDGEELVAPDGTRAALALRLPGPVNRLNAAFAVVVAGALGVPAPDALARLAHMDRVGGRYRTVVRDGRHVRLLLAKNPAGWAQVLDLLAEGPPRPIVVAVNDREADGRDVSWLWDVEFERLARHRVSAAGTRAADLSVRLAYAGVAHRLVDDPMDGFDDPAGGGGELVGNYTAFHDADRALG